MRRGGRGRPRDCASKRINAAEAAELVRSGMWIEYGGLFNQPTEFDRALADRIGDLRDVKVRTTLSLRPLAVMEADPAGDHVFCISLHFGGHERALHDRGRCHYLPVNLGEIPDYYRRFISPPDVVVLKARPPDANGWMNFGPVATWWRALVEAGRRVIIEPSPSIPFAHGRGNAVHLSEVDHILEGPDLPLPELRNPPPTAADEAVARLVAAEIEDGACLQIGIGSMPNAICSLLAERGVRDLGIHTEMLPDGVAELYRRGLVSGARKKTHRGKLVYSFAAGSGALYATIADNPDFLCLPVDLTNPPHIVMRNPNVVSINGTTQVDLTGQAASESDGARHISGTGGQAQFVRGAYASRGGKSFICLPSTYERRGVRKSRIVPHLTAGTIVTTTRADIMYVATEYGMVNLKGRSVPERARLLTAIAHPDFREDLERAAHAAGLMPRGFNLRTDGV